MREEMRFTLNRVSKLFLCRPFAGLFFFIFHFFFVFCFLVNGWSWNVVVNCYLFIFFHLLRSYVASLSFGTFVTSKSLALMSEYNKNEKRKTETPFKFLLIRTLPKCNEDFFFVEWLQESRAWNLMSTGSQAMDY